MYCSRGAEFTPYTTTRRFSVVIILNKTLMNIDKVSANGKRGSDPNRDFVLSVIP